MSTAPLQSAAPSPRSGAALWASAAVLAALILVQAGRNPLVGSGRGRGGDGGGAAPVLALFEGRAMADVVSRVGDYTLLTFDGGNEDILAVLDGRGEELYFYMVRNQNKLEYLGRESLRTLFSDAKVAGAGGVRK